MHRAFAVTGFSFVLAVLLASPTFAQPTLNQPPAAQPAPAPVVEQAEPALDVPLDELLASAATPEDRRRMLMRCIGPPPKSMMSEAPKPASEPDSSEAAEASLAR